MREPFFAGHFAALLMRRLMCLYRKKVSKLSTMPFTRLNGATQSMTKVKRFVTFLFTAVPISTSASIGIWKAAA